MEVSTRTETTAQNIQAILRELCHSKASIELVTEDQEKISCIIDKLVGETSFQVTIKGKNQKDLLKENKEYSLGCGGKEGQIYSFISRCLDDGTPVVTLSIPEEMNVIEQRSHKRFSTLTMNNPYLELLTETGNEIYILNDLSQGGLSFLIPSHLSEKVRMGDKIKIKKMGKQVFQNYLEGIVIHISSLNSSTTSSLKIGVRFMPASKE